MQVILIQDVDNLGGKNELVTVKNGYARNYLIPQKFAVEASPSNLKQLEEKLKEKVTVSCILYPKLSQNWIDNCKAGIIDSLYQMILLNSGFLTPQQAMLLTTQL